VPIEPMRRPLYSAPWACAGSSVFQHHQAVLVGDLHDRVHVRRLAVQVDRHNGLGLGRDGRFDLRGVHRVAVGVHVHEHGLGVRVHDRRNRRDERVRDRDDFVAFADAHGEQRHMERGGTRVVADGVLGARVLGERLFERGDFGAQHERRVLEGAADGFQDFVLDALILLFEVEEWDHGVQSSLSSTA